MRIHTCIRTRTRTRTQCICNYICAHACMYAYVGEEILIDDDSSDEDDHSSSLQVQSQTKRKIFGLILTFIMTFRIVCNISDQAILLLLKFAKYFIKVIGNTFEINELSKDDINFPLTIYGCYSFLNQKNLATVSTLLVHHVICYIISN